MTKKIEKDELVTSDDWKRLEKEVMDEILGEKDRDRRKW